MMHRILALILAGLFGLSVTLIVVNLTSSDRSSDYYSDPVTGTVREVQRQEPGPAGDPLKDWVQIFDNVFKICDGPNLVYLAAGASISVVPNSAECVGWNK